MVPCLNLGLFCRTRVQKQLSQSKIVRSISAKNVCSLAVHTLDIRDVLATSLAQNIRLPSVPQWAHLPPSISFARAFRR